MQKSAITDMYTDMCVVRNVDLPAESRKRPNVVYFLYPCIIILKSLAILF